MATIRKLNHSEVVKVALWIQGNTKMISEERPLFSQLHKMILSETKIDVADSTIADLVRQFLPDYIPKSLSKSKEYKDRLRGLARHVKALYDKLGEPVPSDLESLCKGGGQPTTHPENNGKPPVPVAKVPDPRSIPIVKPSNVR